MLFSVFYSIFSSRYFPFPPRSNNIELGVQSKKGELKSDLQQTARLITVSSIKEIVERTGVSASMKIIEYKL